MNQATDANQRGLRVRDVRHAYGRTAVLRGVSLDVDEGEIHCLLGPSGSGKTTLLRLIAGLEIVKAGEIEIFGRLAATVCSHVPPEQRSIGFVFQDYALFPHLSVRRNVEYGIRQRDERTRRAEELLDRVGMIDFANAMPHTLSGGQQQRVALARALARTPQVMLLDEPFSGLDARLRDEIRGSTVEILKRAGVATVMVTHDPVEAMAISDRISIIDQGRIEKCGEPRDLYLRPGSQRVALALGEANVLSGTVTNGRIVTAIGAVDARELSEGKQAIAIVRPEFVVISADAGPEGVPAQVRNVRFLGERTKVELATECGTSLIALMPMSQVPTPGTSVFVSTSVAPSVMVAPIENNDRR